MPRTDHLRVADIATYTVDVNDDVLPDRFFEIDYRSATRAQYRELFRQVYLFGNCAVFALALNRRFDLPIARFLHDYGLHYACRVGPGIYLDAAGIVTEAEIRTRYGYPPRARGKRVSIATAREDALLSDDKEFPDLLAADFVIRYLGLAKTLQTYQKTR